MEANMNKSADIHPDFIKFESKVMKVTKIIEDMIAGQTGEGETGVPTFDFNKIDLDDFIATTDEVRTVKPDSSGKRLRCANEQISSDDDDSEEDELDEVDKKSQLKDKEGKPQTKPLEKELNFSIKPQELPDTLDKFTFMQQLEEDANQRTKQREEREKIAQEFRKQGNVAFRAKNYERAILLYTKAIEHVKDSPILYNNRAIAYIKLKNYRRAIMDSDFVLNRLDNRDLRAWMYRAAGCKRLLETENYQSAIRQAKELNSKQHQLIDDFVTKIEQDIF